MSVRVEVESEEALFHHPARVLVYKDNKLVFEVIAKIELKQGADGRHYSCVTLKKKNMVSGEALAG